MQLEPLTDEARAFATSHPDAARRIGQVAGVANAQLGARIATLTLARNEPEFAVARLQAHVRWGANFTAIDPGDDDALRTRALDVLGHFSRASVAGEFVAHEGRELLLSPAVTQALTGIATVARRSVTAHDAAYVLAHEAAHARSLDLDATQTTAGTLAMEEARADLWTRLADGVPTIHATLELGGVGDTLARSLDMKYQSLRDVLDGLLTEAGIDIRSAAGRRRALAALDVPTSAFAAGIADAIGDACRLSARDRLELAELLPDAFLAGLGQPSRASLDSIRSWIIERRGARAT